MTNWEKPECTICKTKKHLKVLWSGVTTWEHSGRFTFVQCKKCGLVFQSPRAPFSQAVKYYPGEAYWGRDVTKYETNTNLLKEREHAYSFLYNGIFRLRKRGRILDIGSGLGLFLSKFKERGWTVVGTDISKDVAKFSKKLFGVKVLIGDVVKMKLPKEYFDLVTLNGVFEHIYNPSETLKKIRQVLKSDGILVVTVPNIESLGYLVHKKEWYHLQPGRHIYHFSPKTIKKLFNQEGFAIIKTSHSYDAHNYYSLFENIRYRFSAKFKRGKSGGLAKGTVNSVVLPSAKSLSLEVGKFVANFAAKVGCFIEPLIRRGEVITVYAKKK